MKDSEIQDLQKIISDELAIAQKSREQGNEGRARVCARRAAGWAVESIYVPDQGQSLPDANAYRFLIWFKECERFPQNLREAAGRLTARVDKDFKLPFKQDPIDDAKMIVDWIMSVEG
ncbi:MAG: hypothetical protein PVI81_04075 [Anaerolineales bacterium]